MDYRMDLRKSYFPGKVVQGNKAICELPEYINLCGGKAFVLVTPSMQRFMQDSGLIKGQAVEVFRGPCCWQEINRLIETAQKGDYTVVVAIGGGKVVDSAKVVADKLHLKAIMVPSVAATSAPFSACAVIYTPEDIYESVYYEENSPDVLLLDNKIIANAPLRYFVAGMGDALSVLFEGRGCVRTSSPNSLHARQTFCALAMGQYCFDTLITYGLQAKTAYANKVINQPLEQMIEVNLMSSGIAFEGGGLASAHAIHNGLTILPEIHNYLHGEIVAFGVLAELHLTNSCPEEMEIVYNFCEEIGLPTTFGELGIEGISRERLIEVAEFTHKDPYLSHEGHIITPEDILAAMVAADAMGRYRKANP